MHSRLAQYLLLAVSLLAMPASAEETLPLPDIRLPENPILPPSVILHDGRKVLIDRINLKVRYSPATKTLECESLGQCWLINYPLTRIRRPDGIDDSAMAVALFGESLDGIKNYYVRLGGVKQALPRLAPVAVAPPPTNAAIIVDLSGIDTAERHDDSEARTFAKIQQAVDAAQPGDTILVRCGTYRETVQIEKGGVPGAPIIIQGDASLAGDLPVLSGNDAPPENQFREVSGLPGLFRADNWTGKPASLTIDGQVATERAAASQLLPGEFSLNQSSRELAFPTLFKEIESQTLQTEDWKAVQSDGEGYVDLEGLTGPAYLATWLWLPPKKKAEVWDPRFPEPLTGHVAIQGPYRAGRQTNSSLSTQLNQYRLWINGNLMPASGVPGGPTPNMAYGRDGDEWQRLPFREGWNHVVVLLSRNRRKAAAKFRFGFPKGFEQAVSASYRPEDSQQVPERTDNAPPTIQHWSVLEMPADESDAGGAVYLRLPDGDHPSNHAIDMGNRGELLSIQAPNVVVGNIEFAHGSQFQQKAQVNVNAHSVVIEHCRFREPEVRCLSVNTQHWSQDDPMSIIRGNVFLSPGSLAIGGAGAAASVTTGNQNGNVPGRGRMLVEYNTVRDNNRFGFKRQWESGGMKFFRLTGSVIRHNDIQRGDGPGLWLDWEHFNNRVDANLVRDVPMCAFGVEASPGPNLICNNVALDVRDGNAWFKYAILGWSSARLWAVHNTIDSAHGVMFAEGPDNRGTQWKQLPERGAALANNLIVGRPVSIHRGWLQWIAGNRFYGPNNGGLNRYSKWSYAELRSGEIERSSQFVDQRVPHFFDRDRLDLRLREPDTLADTGVDSLAVRTDGKNYDVLLDVQHDYFGLPRFSDDPILPGAYRYPVGDGDDKQIIEVERKNGTLERNIRSVD